MMRECTDKTFKGTKNDEEEKVKFLAWDSCVCLQAKRAGKESERSGPYRNLMLISESVFSAFVMTLSSRQVRNKNRLYFLSKFKIPPVNEWQRCFEGKKSKLLFSKLPRTNLFTKVFLSNLLFEWNWTKAAKIRNNLTKKGKSWNSQVGTEAKSFQLVFHHSLFGWQSTVFHFRYFRIGFVGGQTSSSPHIPNNFCMSIKEECAHK